MLLRSVGMQPGRRARRRAPDRRADGPARQGARVPRRPAGHRRRDRSTSPAWCWSARSTATSSSAINVHGPLAVGLSGEDAGLIAASARDPDLGFVGDVAAVEPGDPRAAAGRGPHPGHRPPSGPTPTGQAYNINADTAAGAIAEALGAEKLVYLTDVEGLLADVDDPVVARSAAITADELQALIADGALTGGHDPEGRGLRCTPCEHGVGSRPHPRRPRRRTCCCSSCSPTPASAPWSPARRGAPA